MAAERTHLQRQLGLSLAVLVTSLATSACGSVLMSTPVTSTAKQWNMQVLQVKDGPNSYARGDGHCVPDSGRFLWVKIALTNQSGTARAFNYERCDLDDDGQRILPSLVDMDKVVNILVSDKEETLQPGETVGRNMVFAYPPRSYPTRLVCGELTFPLALTH